MKSLTNRIAKMQREKNFRQSGRSCSRRIQFATLCLAGLVGIVGAGAAYEDVSSQAGRLHSETAVSGDRTHPVQDGAEIYQARCLSCHQANGGGVPGVFPPLVGTEWVTGDEEVLIRVVLNGMTGEMEVNGLSYSGAMPPWGAFLTDEEMADLLTYIRTEWNNDASEVTPETIAKVREAVADRKEPWTVEELEALREAREKAKAEAAEAKAAEETAAKAASEAQEEK